MAAPAVSAAPDGANAKTVLGRQKVGFGSPAADAPVNVWALDRNGVFMLGEGKDLEALGLEPGGVIGRSVFDLYGDVPEIIQGVRRALAGDSVSLVAEVDGVGFAFRYAPLRSTADEVVGVVAVAVDVTKRWQTEAGLLVERCLMSEMLRSHERDRRLIAYEIHDGPVQDVTGAQMHLESLLCTSEVPPGPARHKLELALSLVRKAVRESRELIGGLRPPILDESGVVSAIEHLIDDQRADDGPSIELKVHVQFDRLEPLLEGTIYRIVQEAITNVRRHSKSDRAEIRLVQVDDRIQLEIRDGGVGFNPADVQQKRLGLQGIRERARLLHGRAAIDSAPGKGTRVFVDLPVADAPHEFAIMNDRSIE
jgi:signal transduction histidine kinase